MLGVNDNGTDVEEPQHVRGQSAIVFDDGRIYLVSGLERDQSIDDRRFGKVLELVRRVARRIAGQNPLLMYRLVVLAKHNDWMLRSGNTKAVAPGNRQVEKGHVTRHLAGNGLVDVRHVHVREGERDGEVFKEHEAGAKQERGGYHRSRPALRRQLGANSPHPKRSQHGQAQQQHHAVAARVAVALKEGELGDQGEGQGQAGILSVDAQAGSQRQEPEDQG